MYDYMTGKITEQTATTITLEVGNIGYLISVANPYAFIKDEVSKVYLYQHIKEDEHLLYGFTNSKERELFLKLISVKGIGPKMALPILATGSIGGIVDAIERENILYLKKFPKIGEKVARQIVLDLKGKIHIEGELIQGGYDELAEVLQGLGYKEKEYKQILVKVDRNLPLESQVKEALRLLLK